MSRSLPPCGPGARLLLALGVACGLTLGAAAASAQDQPDEVLLNIDYENIELAAFIKTIAERTGRNFIYDDRVRGQVTIHSPQPVPIEQAYAVFESVLQVKGFTTVETPGGAIKIIPLRDAKESPVDTRTGAGMPSNRDRYVTRLIPMRFIDAASIVNTLKPLVSKDAAMAAYEATNTVILTESASNIRRIMSILESIDVETYKEELAVIRVEFADASALAEQVGEIYGDDQTSARPAPRRRRTRRPGNQPQSDGSSSRGELRILTDERTNSLIVLAARSTLEDVRGLVRKLDVPATVGGRINVYYLNHANAEELAQTVNSLISGQPRTPAAGGAAGGGQAQAIRSAVEGLAEGISVTADPATNSLVIQASREGYDTLRSVIEKLDVQRPQVLVEALIMEVNITDAQELGFAAFVEVLDGTNTATIQTATEAASRGALAGMTGGGSEAFLQNGLFARYARQEGDTTIQAVLRAVATDNSTNIVSAPHILTSDNEQAEIRIGDNIPIISSRVQSAAGVETGLSTSVNVERQDVGVTLRVTPQITEGDTLRMEIFQEITTINEALQESVGNAEDVGVPLSNRRIENTVVVDDGETVVIGGLLSEDYDDLITKVPWLGNVPVLGWLFKSTSRQLVKTNLLVFLTPHIIREAEDLERETIRKREEYIRRAEGALALAPEEREALAQRRAAAQAGGEDYADRYTRNPVRAALLKHESRYPPERMKEIDEAERAAREAAEAAAREQARAEYYVQAALLADESEAIETLTDLIDSGWDGSLISGEYGGEVVFEVRIGPFESLKEANRAASVIRRSHGLEPAVMIQSSEETP